MDDECIIEIQRASNKESDLSAQNIHDILVDRYHNNMKVFILRKKYKISQKTWTSINKKYTESFINKFGKKKKKTITIDEMEQFWSNNI